MPRIPTYGLERTLHRFSPSFRLDHGIMQVQLAEFRVYSPGFFVCKRIGIRLDPETGPAARALFGRCWVTLWIEGTTHWQGFGADLLFDHLVLDAVAKLNRVTRRARSSAHARTLRNIAQSLRKARGLGILDSPEICAGAYVIVSISRSFEDSLREEYGPATMIAGRVLLEGELFRERSSGK